MKRLEPILIDKKPDVVLVYGDVNSTVATALVTAKLSIPLAHVEAGLRSFDRRMPEEINRVVTDQLSDYLFTPSIDTNENLIKEGINRDRIHFVGNVMIDTLVNMIDIARNREYFKKFGIKAYEYGLVTLHRPSNVDKKEILESFMNSIVEISNFIPLIFPVHPRMKRKLDEFGLSINHKGNLFLIEPVGYIDFLSLEMFAKFVITDSEGVQEETTYLNVPCITFRENTERPVTVDLGTNIIVGRDVHLLEEEVLKILSGKSKKGKTPPFWDGHAGERIAKVIDDEF